jgi:hypothetical protein
MYDTLLNIYYIYSFTIHILEVYSEYLFIIEALVPKINMHRPLLTCHRNPSIILPMYR